MRLQQPIAASIYDSAGSIATPLPESDLDDEQLRALLASLLYLQGREASAERSLFFNALPAICLEKAVIMKTGEDLILQSEPIPNVTASRTHAKFASWTSGSF